MDLDMSIIRRKRGERGRSKTSKFEKQLYREYYRDGEVIHTDYADLKTGKIKYNQYMNTKSDYFIDTVEIAYWRKANAVHKYFVDNLQKGKDDCRRYKLTKSALIDLYAITNRLLDEIELKDGKVRNGYSMKKNILGKQVKKYNYIKGKVIKNKKICKAILPTEDGFFFDSTDYDEHYYEMIKYTNQICKIIYENYNLDTDELYYSSSW